MPRNTQAHKDRANYGLILQNYEGYLTVLENLIVLRSQIEAGPDPFTPELEKALVEVRDDIYRRLEKRSDDEK